MHELGRWRGRASVLAMAAAVVTVDAAAKDLYVDVQGQGGACDDGRSWTSNTEATPWCSLLKAGRDVRPGDTVWVKAGTYGGFEVNYKAGTAASPILFRPVPGHHVVVDYSAGGSSGFTLSIYQSSYLTIEGFELLDSYVLAQDFLALDACVPADLARIKTYKNHGILMNADTNAELHHVTLRALEIHHHSRLGLAAWHSEALSVVDCNIHHNGHYGVYLAGDHLNVSGNHIHHNKAFGAHFYKDGAVLLAPRIERNRFEDNGMARCGWHESSDVVRPNSMIDGVLLQAQDGLIANNVIARNRGVGLTVYGPARNNALLNNTIVGNGFVTGAPQNGIEELYTSAANTRLVNNILYGNARVNNALVSYTGSHNLETNPGFMDEGAGDYRLREDSPARDTGLALPEVTVDLVGLTRPQGPAYDLGAYELAATTDGGAPQQDGGSTQQDGGSTQQDGGSTQQDGGSTQQDGGGPRSDAGADASVSVTPTTSSDAGYGCTTTRPRDGAYGLALLGALLLWMRRRRGPRRSMTTP